MNKHATSKNVNMSPDTFMKHLTAYSFTMLQCYHFANLSYTCRLVMIFPEYSQTSCNSVGIIPAKYINCILVLIIKIPIYTFLFCNKNLESRFQSD